MSTRIILITIQMIMLAKYNGNFTDLSLFGSEVIEFDETNDDSIIDEFSFLRTFHLSVTKKN